MFCERKTRLENQLVVLAVASLVLVLTVGSSLGQTCHFESGASQGLSAVKGSIIFANTATSPVQFEETSKIFVGGSSKLRFGYSIKNVSEKDISKITVGLKVVEANGISGYHEWFEFPRERSLILGASFSSLDCPDLEDNDSVRQDLKSEIETWPGERLVVIAVVESVDFEDGSKFNNRGWSAQIDRFILDFVEQCRDDGNCIEFVNKITQFLATPSVKEEES